jgi:hypothetical protein
MNTLGVDVNNYEKSKSQIQVCLLLFINHIDLIMMSIILFSEKEYCTVFGSSEYNKELEGQIDLVKAENFEIPPNYNP